MKLLRVAALIALVSLAFRAAAAAINPEEFKRIASDVVKLREIARIVEKDTAGARTLQRITIVGEVVERLRVSSGNAEHRVIVIDYTIDLTARAAEAENHKKTNGTRPGPQFMFEPDPPALDAKREFWAHLAPVAGRLGNVNRHAGSKVNMRRDDFAGPVFVPVSGQYSWDAPAGHTGSAPVTAKVPETFTGIVRTGMVAIGGESTGIVLETKAGRYELDTRGDRAAAATLESLDGKTATITGDYRPRPGVEVKERRIIVVRGIRAAP